MFPDSEVTVADTAVTEAVTVPVTVADSVVDSALRVPIVADSIEDGKIILSLRFSMRSISKVFPEIKYIVRNSINKNYKENLHSVGTCQFSLTR